MWKLESGGIIAHLFCIISTQYVRMYTSPDTSVNAGKDNHQGQYNLSIYSIQFAKDHF